MLPPNGRSFEAEIDRLTVQTRQLVERLHRLTIALALSEEMVAELLDQAAAARAGDEAKRQRLRANQARQLARHCRAFGEQLADS